MTLKTLLRWEWALVTVLVWLVFISVPLTLGRIGLSWDGLNHHIYLGWTANHMRFDKDLLAAGSQAYQFPYLYWPVYKLAVEGFDGMTAGIVLATLHAATIPPVWIIAKAITPECSYYGLFMRLASVALAFMSALILKTFEATSNDLLAATPVLWSMALIIKSIRTTNNNPSQIYRTSFVSGILSGVSVAAKFSNGPIVVLMPFLLLALSSNIRTKFLSFSLHCISAGAAFIILFAPWGYHLCKLFGNPIYPFYEGEMQHMMSIIGIQSC